jgi:hypothetical protein
MTSQLIAHSLRDPVGYEHMQHRLSPASITGRQKVSNLRRDGSRQAL